MNRTEIYLDHAATTPIDPHVLQAMTPYLTERFGNPSSIYAAGREARAGLDRARATIAGLLNRGAREVIFTSGGTESDNIAVKGVAWWHRLHRSGNHIVTTTIEHHAVLNSAAYLERFGFEVSYVAPGPDGIVGVDDIAAAVRPDTMLISVIYANNEIGTVQPIAEIGAVARERGITFHTDAVQAAGSLPLIVDDLNVDLLSISAHKLYGPKGVGLLYARRGTPILWQQSGGSQEHGQRAGTENVAGAVGLAEALQLAHADREARADRIRALRDHLIDRVLRGIPGAHLNGHPTQRLPNNANFSFEGIEGETLLLNLDMHGIAASSGSACTTGSTEPSHVLTALGLSPDLIRGSLRLTLGKDTTAEQIDRTVEVLAEAVAHLRGLNVRPAR